MLSQCTFRTQSFHQILGRNQNFRILLQQFGEVLEERVLRTQKIELIIPLFSIHQIGQELPAISGDKLSCQLDNVPVIRSDILFRRRKMSPQLSTHKSNAEIDGGSAMNSKSGGGSFGTNCCSATCFNNSCCFWCAAAETCNFCMPAGTIAPESAINLRLCLETVQIRVFQ